jgi:1,2-phenylacetyl-CoA epoxidase PaaB subunit
MKNYEVKVYGRAKEAPEYRALTDLLVVAKNQREAGRLAREKYAKKFAGMEITHVEIGGIRQSPGNGVAV